MLIKINNWKRCNRYKGLPYIWSVIFSLASLLYDYFFMCLTFSEWVVVDLTFDFDPLQPEVLVAFIECSFPTKSWANLFHSENENGMIKSAVLIQFYVFFWPFLLFFVITYLDEKKAAYKFYRRCTYILRLMIIATNLNITTYKP